MVPALRSSRPRRTRRPGPTRSAAPDLAEERCLVVATACQQPADHGLAGHSNWSGSLLAQVLTASGRVLAISARSVQRILKAAAIRPHRCTYWKQPIDPNFAAKMRPIIDLYLRPPPTAPSSAPTRRPAFRLSNGAIPTGSLLAPASSADAPSRALVQHAATALSPAWRLRLRG